MQTWRPGGLGAVALGLGGWVGEGAVGGGGGMGAGGAQGTGFGEMGTLGGREGQQQQQQLQLGAGGEPREWQSEDTAGGCASGRDALRPDLVGWCRWCRQEPGSLLSPCAPPTPLGPLGLVTHVFYFVALCCAAMCCAGAGDCFTATYAVAVLEGLAPQEALRFASAAACICVQRKGAMPSLPSRAEVDALLAASSS